MITSLYFFDGFIFFIKFGLWSEFYVNMKFLSGVTFFFANILGLGELNNINITLITSWCLEQVAAQ